MGCLPNLTDPSDAGVDASGDVSSDAGDAGADTGDGCETIADPVAWCMSESKCGTVDRGDCPDIDCGETCSDSDSCVENACMCDDDKIDVVASCSQEGKVCGALTERTTCSGRVIECGMCANFEACGEGVCELPRIEPPSMYSATQQLRLGTGMGYGDGYLLMSSDPPGGPENTIFSVNLATSEVSTVDIEDGTSNPLTLGADIDVEGAYALIGSPAAPNESNGLALPFKREGDTWLPFQNQEQGGIQTLVDPLTSEEVEGFGKHVAVDYPYFAVSTSRYNPTPDITNARGLVHLWKHEGGQFVALDTTLLNPTVEEQSTFLNAQYGESIDLGSGMFFVSSTKAFNPLGKACGLVRVFFLEEAESGQPLSSDLRDVDCDSQNEGVADKVLGSNFGQSVHFDGETLLVSAPRYDQAEGPGALYVFDYDATASDVSDRFAEPTRIELPLIEGLFLRDDAWSLTRAGDTIIVGLDAMGMTKVEDDPMNPSLLNNEGLIAIVRKDAQGTWAFEKYWIPGDFEGETYRFGAVVAGTPEGKLYVSAPAATTPTGTGDRDVSGRGATVELDMNEP